jgi:hypothetical protein
MTFEECIDNAASAGDISRDSAEDLKRQYKRFKRGFEHLGPLADSEAGAALQKQLQAESLHQRRKAKLQIKAITRIDYDLRNHKNAAGEQDFAEGAVMLFEHFGEAKFADLAHHRKTKVAMAHGKLTALLMNFERGKLLGDLGRMNKAQLDNVVREAFGENTGDEAARIFAQQWLKLADDMRLEFNAAGGAIGKLEKWGLPQHHNAEALRQRGLEAWKSDIKPLLDVDRMKHPLTGETVLADELDGVLDEIYDTITTEGWIDRKPSLTPFGRGALANQRSEHRFLIFKSADDWLAYQRNYGRGGDPFAAMMGHINMMAKDTAAMEILGPNPNATVEWLKQSLMKQGQMKGAGKRSFLPGSIGGGRDRASGAEKKIETLWQVYRGTLETPVNGRWAGILAGSRNWITASVMGSASLSSISDVGTSKIARVYAGIGGGAFADIIKAFSGATREEAVAAGLILDSAEHVFHAQARYVGTLDGRGISGFVADRVLAYSGLTAWTQAAKHAFGLAFMHELATRASLGFDQLPKALRDTLERHGLSAADWDAIRAAKLHDMGKGRMILRPTEIDAKTANSKLTAKYLSMIHRETAFAVPEAGLRSRAFFVNESRPGTLWGEVQKSFAMFKSFGAAFVILHGLRISNLWRGGRKGTAAQYAAGLLFSTMFFGGMALQMKQIAGGRDPRDMKTKEFWGAALLQGGGLGLYGDFLFADLNRYGGGLAPTLQGPVLQRGTDILNLTLGNMIQLATGQETNFGRESVRFLKSNLPGTNIWYVKAAWERNVLDQLQLAVDPEAAKAFKRQQRYWQKNYGQDYWWRPGERLPDRAPDMGALLGAR